MELKDLRVFLAVATAGSISGAAEILCSTQPALSRRMRELEGYLGKRLFMRGSRRITLTEEGIYLRRRAEEVLAHVAATEAEFFSRHDAVRGEVRICAGETLATGFVARAMKKSTLAHPGLRWKLVSAPADTAVRQLDADLLDFALLLEPADISRCDYIRLNRACRFGLLHRNDHPLSALDHIRPEHVAGIPLLWPRRSLLQKELAAWAGRARTLNIVGTFSLLYDASFLVEQGLGCALCVADVTCLMAGRPLGFSLLRPSLESRLVMAWKKDARLSQAAAAFHEILLREAAAA